MRGNIEMWSVKDKKEIAKFEAPDSTDVKWSPDGKKIMTSTCAPRLRMGNGMKVSGPRMKLKNCEPIQLFFLDLALHQ